MTSGNGDSPRLESPLIRVKGIGPARARAFTDAGFHCIRDLLELLPFRYEDRRTVSDVSEVAGEGPHTLAGRLVGLQPIYLRRRRMTMVRGRLVSGTAEIPVVWFNRPYVKSQVDESVEYLVHGVVRSRGEGWELVNPSLEVADRARLAGRIVPVYPAAGKVSPNQVRVFVSNVLDSGIIGHIEEQLPHRLLEDHDLPPLDEALWNLHRPDVDGDVELLNTFSTRYHSRLIYEEALRLQLQLGLMRSRVIETPKGHCYDLGDGAADRLSGMLPFKLTGAQERVVGEIMEDLTSPFPMMRLLQGDVGCGKTAVAAIAMAAAAESGLQAALMAPTELLAEQHLLSLKGLLGERFPVALLSASAAGKDQTRASIAAGGVKVVVGTHALIQAGVQFAKLGLVVVDEQHRFGVAQRRELQHKGDRPDLLVMTATPIPRSLTMTFYGDLALSIIDELPPGRAPVETRVVSHDKREGVYSWLESELEQGARAYVVIPLIDESSKVRAESIAGLGRELAERLDRFKPAVLHGRMTSEERAGVMKAFATGGLGVLIATTLIEVGVDVPEATIMVIESSERFGLSQLHQLRGRVGRGSGASSCVAIHGTASEESLRRLEVFHLTTDGFRIAEADLEIRGPGDLLGTRQSGVPALRVVNLVRDRLWIEKARQDARELFSSAPERAKTLASGPGSVAAYDRLAGA